MSSNLVPEQRMNIKGHLVTKHVRSDAKPNSASKTVIPAPQPAAPVIEAPRLLGVLEASYAYSDGMRLKDFTPETVRRIEVLLDQAENDLRDYQLKDDIRSAFKRCAINSDDGLFYLDQIAVFGKYTMHDHNNNVQHYLNGLRRVPELRHVIDFMNNGTPKQRQQAEALVEFTTSFGEGPAANEFIDFGFDDDNDEYEAPEEDRKVYVKDAEMRRLIMDYPTRVKEMTDIIGRDYITDAGHLREILEHGEQALRDGLL